MTYFSFSWWYKFRFYINYLSISSLNSINVSLSSWLFLIAFLSLNSTKFSLDLSLMNSFPLNTFILIFVSKFFCSYICVHLKHHQLLIVYFSSCLFDIRSLLDCSPASCSFFSSFFFLLSSLLSFSLIFAFQPVPFGFSQEDFGLKPFPFGKSQMDLAERLKEDEEEVEEDKEDEENEKDELKAGDHSSNKLINFKFLFQ